MRNALSDVKAMHIPPCLNLAFRTTQTFWHERLHCSWCANSWTTGNNSVATFFAKLSLNSTQTQLNFNLRLRLALLSVDPAILPPGHPLWTIVSKIILRLFQDYFQTR